jgi:DNA-binding GntR family transcriptional regulator
MKTLIATTGLLISLAFAHSIEVQAQDTGKHAQHHPGAPSGQADMGDQRSMQQHMRDMQETMQRIQDATDPAERRELMAQHRQQMHEAMGSMCGMMGGKGMMSGKNMMGGDGSHTGMEDMNPEARREMMQEHMQMMKGMMDQMKMHMEADKPMQQSQ